MYKTQIQKLQEAAEMVKSRCENLLSENNLITKNKNKKLGKFMVITIFYKAFSGRRKLSYSVEM